MTGLASGCHYTAITLSSHHPSAVILEGSLSVISYAMQNNITAKRIKMNTPTTAGHNARLQGTSTTHKDAYSMTLVGIGANNR
jgi:hypothetical protein